MTRPTIITRDSAARDRSQAVVQRGDRPGQRRYGPDLRSAPASPLFPAARATAPLQARMTVQRAGDGGGSGGNVTLTGHATSYEQPYEMYDFFGPYTEVVSAGAGAASLNRADLNVVFLLNHRGMPMAKTTTGTLDLSEEDAGLLSVARPLMTLATSVETAAAVEAGLIDEMSFAFMIVRGSWSPDWTEYRIHEYDIHRGDVSAVTFGANPFTDISAERAAGPDAARSPITPADRARARTVLCEDLIRA